MMKEKIKELYRLLEERRRLANDLISICSDVDRLIEEVGGDLDDERIADSVLTGCMIYCEPDVAAKAVKDYVKELVNNEE